MRLVRKNFKIPHSVLSNHPSLTVKGKLRKLAEVISALAKFVWPQRVALDEVLGIVGKLNPTLSNLDETMSGFDYESFVRSNCQSVRVESLREFVFLQWMEKPQAM